MFLMLCVADGAVYEGWVRARRPLGWGNILVRDHEGWVVFWQETIEGLSGLFIGNHEGGVVLW